MLVDAACVVVIAWGVFRVVGSVRRWAIGHYVDRVKRQLRDAGLSEEAARRVTTPEE